MPRPHYPTTGGPHLTAWNTGEARKRHRASSRTQTLAASSPAGLSPAAAPPAIASSHAFNAVTNHSPKILPDFAANRTRSEQASSLPTNTPAGARSSAPSNPLAALFAGRHGNGAAAMLWIAGCLSLAALLFTLLVLLHRG